MYMPWPMVPVGFGRRCSGRSRAVYKRWIFSTPANICISVPNASSAKTPRKPKAAYRHGRSLLAQQGWSGVCQWVGELLSVTDTPECERRRQATERLVGYFSKHMQRLNYAERLQA